MHVKKIKEEYENEIPHPFLSSGENIQQHFEQHSTPEMLEWKNVKRYKISSLLKIFGP